MMTVIMIVLLVMTTKIKRWCVVYVSRTNHLNWLCGLWSLIHLKHVLNTGVGFDKVMNVIPYPLGEICCLIGPRHPLSTTIPSKTCRSSYGNLVCNWLNMFRLDGWRSLWHQTLPLWLATVSLVMYLLNKELGGWLSLRTNPLPECNRVSGSVMNPDYTRLTKSDHWG